MNTSDDLSKTNHSIGNLFRFSKEEDPKGWVNIPSSRSWTPEDVRADEEDNNNLRASSAHSRSFFSKIARSKSMEEAMRPMTTISHTLTKKLPRASFANMRSYSFRHTIVAPQSSVHNTALSPKKEEEDDDDSDDDSFQQESVSIVKTDPMEGLTVKVVLPPPRQDGTMIRRRRDKQLSKGRRNVRRVKTRSVSVGSDASWEKFLAYAAPTVDMSKSE